MKQNIFLFITFSLIISCSSGQKNSADLIINEPKFREINGEKFSSTQIDSIPDGEFIEYHTNGQMRILGTFKNYKKDGWFITYYDDGSTESEAIYFQDISIGIFKDFYENGQIASYICHYTTERDYGGDVFYLSDYDSDGNLILEEGDYLPPVVLYSSNAILPKDSLWIADIYLAQPPHMSNRLTAIVLNENNEELLNEEFVFPEGYCNYYFTKSFKNEGSYEFNLISNFVNQPNYRDTLIIDTLKIEIIVE